MFLLTLLLACGPDVQIAKQEVDGDGDGYTADVDCDDARAEVNGDADETCDGVDNDCDGEVDVDAVDAPTWFADTDGDGWGDDDAAVVACAAPAGHVGVGGDCNDAVGSTHPDADERCNEVDDDCDGTVDDAPVDATEWYLDADGDGHGDPVRMLAACEAPEDHVAVGDDCDDADAEVYPDAPEDDCTDPTDYDCDGSVAWADADGDGAAACVDCDDADPARSPLLAEVCDAADVDEDCDGRADGSDAEGQTDWFLDADGDGYGAGAGQSACNAPIGWAPVDGDCDDLDALASPGGAEVCAGGDEDCDGLEGDADPTVDAATKGTWYRDADGDGFGDPSRAVTLCAVPLGYVADATDCDDTDATISPAGQETCAAGDEDCDGLADDDDGSVGGAPTWHRDADGDGWGDDRRTFAACDRPAGYVDGGGDCDDGDAGTNPDGVEVCAAGDEDCDGLEGDEDGAADRGTWFVDGDRDGFGAGAPVEQCDAPAGWVAVDGDCDDGDAGTNPYGVEVCAAGDEDCDGLEGDADPSVSDAATWYVDADEDGFGDPSGPDVACLAPAGFVGDDRDCDDADPATNPDGVEVCAPGDEDCDGLEDDADPSVSDPATWYADDDADGFGDADASVVACVAGAGEVADATDCDDAEAAVNPGAPEVCTDGVDDDCDGEPDDGCPAERWSGTAGVEGSASDADLLLYGDASGDLFGEAVASGIDVDADGDEELVVGASSAEVTAGVTWYGHVYMFRGPIEDPADSATGARDGLLVRGPNIAGDTIGSRVWGLDDVDGDGFDEVGAFADNTSEDDVAWIYRGEYSGITEHNGGGAAIRGTYVDAQSAIGQFDDPAGLGRVALGDPLYNSSAGILYVVDPAVRTASLCSYGFGVAGDRFGHAIAGGAGSDVNGDGYDDFFVSAPYDDDTSPDGGAVYTFIGNASARCDNEGKIVASAASDLFGSGIVAPGDITGDGYADLLVGSPADDDGGSGSGVVYLFDALDDSAGTADDSATDAYAKVVGAATGDALGNHDWTGSMSAADVDGDGDADLLVSTEYSDVNGTSSGAAWLIYGPLSGTYSLSSASAWDARFTGDGASDRCGASSALGDLDGDGAAEIIVGCPGGDWDAFTDHGVVGIFSGR